MQQEQSECLLLVDDDEDVREAVADMLTSIGYQTLTATTGEEALEVFKRHQQEISLVLLDVVMPGWNGPETLHHLRTVDTNVKVILCSGYSEDEMLAKAKGQTPTGYLPKPYSFKDLRKSIVSAIQPTAALAVA